MYKESDIAIGLASNGKMIDSDVIANSDIQMHDIYGLSYLLFKHGNCVHKRMMQIVKEFTYRTIFAMFVHFIFFVASGLTVGVTLSDTYFSIFMAFLSPVSYVLEAIFHIEYGQKIFHRVFGLYKNNQINDLGNLEMFGVIISAVLDAAVLSMFVVAEIMYNDTNLDVESGKTLTMETQLIINSIVFAIFHFSRYKSHLVEIWNFTLIESVFFFISLNLIVVNDRIDTIKQLIMSTKLCFFLLFIIVWLVLKKFMFLVWKTLVSSNKTNLEKYKEIEDRLFME